MQHTSLMVPAVAVPLLLDTYPNAAFAYSFRKLRNAYAGSAVRIRRSSDNAELDVGFVGENFDTAAAASHIGGGSGNIVTKYDQSGNGLDLTKSTAIEQPTYLASGPGGKPTAVYATGSAIRLDRTFDLSLYVATTTSLISVIRQDGALTAFSCVVRWGDNSTTNTLNLYTEDASFTRIEWRFGNESGDGAVASTGYPVGWAGGANHIVEGFRDVSDNQGLVADGVTLVSSGSHTSDLSTASARLIIGSDVFGSGFNGAISEVVCWSADLGSTNRTAARTNVNTYYAVF